MKKLVALLLSGAMVLSLAACGGSSNSSSENDAPKNPEDVKLTVWVSGAGAQVDAMKAACDAFAEETGYTIEFSAPGDTYEELMKTKMAANDMPDVFDTHGWSVARYSDFLMPLNDEAVAENINSQIKNIVTSEDGNIYALPFDMDITGLVYNVDVLEEAGVDVDSIKTWADFEAACDAVLAIGKNPIHMGGSNSFTIGWFYDRVAPSYYITDESNSKAEDLKNGTFDADTWAEISALLDSWVTKGYLNDDCVSGEYTADVAALASNETAFLFYGNIAITLGLGINENANLGMMPLPAKTENDEPSLIAGENVALGIWKDTEMKAEAIELLNYLAQPEVAATISQATGNAPALTNVEVDLGMVQPYLDKYADVETFPYFDREYCPSGVWDIICSTGQIILTQKEGAIEDTAQQVLDAFNEKYQ